MRCAVFRRLQADIFELPSQKPIGDSNRSTESQYAQGSLQLLRTIDAGSPVSDAELLQSTASFATEEW